MKEWRSLPVPIDAHDIHLAAHLFQPTRLTLARELRGLSKVELAEKVGRSASALSQFERAPDGLRPDATTVAALAEALAVPASFFTRTSVASLISTDACHFRSLRSTTQRDRRRLVALGTLLGDLVSFLEENIEFPPERVSVIARQASTPSRDQVEGWAVDARRVWGLGLGPISNMVRLLESMGVLVVRVPNQCRDVKAFSTWHHHRPIVFLLADERAASRSRFDAAHELAHLVMHVDASPGNPDREREADQFAAAFLMPRETFSRECPRRLNWEHFFELKQRWGVSLAALVRRAFDLGYLSAASYRRAYVQLNRTNQRIHEEREPPLEQPTLVKTAVELLADDFPKASISAILGLREPDLELLSDGNYESLLT